MFSRTFSRSMVTALVLCALLVLAAPPAQAGQAAGLLGGLSAKLQTWVTAWWPGAVGGASADLKGASHVAVPAPSRSKSDARQGRPARPHPVIRIQCSGGMPDPNGHCV